MVWKRSLNARYILLILWVTLSAYPASSQNDSVVWTEQDWVNAKRGIDYSPPQQKEKKKKEDEIPDEPSSEPRFLNWLNEWFTSTGGKIVVIVLVIGLLVYTLFRLLSVPNDVADEKVKKELAYQLLSVEDNLEESDMDRVLRMALEAGDMKSGVRILYLIVLRELHLKKWITWKKDKTNHDFLNEMSTREFFDDFRRVTLIYELIWYGDTNIRKEDFDVIRSRFEELTSQIKLRSGEKG